MPERVTLGQINRVVDVPVARLWAVVSTFGPEALYFPGCLQSELTGHGIGSLRHLHFDGFEVDERLDMVDLKNYTVSYTMLDPHPLPYEGAVGTVSLKPLGENKTEVTWVATADSVKEAEIEKTAEFVKLAYSGAVDNIIARKA